jgi:hypothetical protein
MFKAIYSIPVESQLSQEAIALPALDIPMAIAYPDMSPQFSGHGNVALEYAIRIPDGVYYEWDGDRWVESPEPVFHVDTAFLQYWAGGIQLVVRGEGFLEGIAIAVHTALSPIEYLFTYALPSFLFIPVTITHPVRTSPDGQQCRLPEGFLGDKVSDPRLFYPGLPPVPMTLDIDSGVFTTVTTADHSRSSIPVRSAFLLFDYEIPASFATSEGNQSEIQVEQVPCIFVSALGQKNAYRPPMARAGRHSWVADRVYDEEIEITAIASTSKHSEWLIFDILGAITAKIDQVGYLEMEPFGLTYGLSRSGDRAASTSVRVLNSLATGSFRAIVRGLVEGEYWNTIF